MAWEERGQNILDHLWHGGGAKILDFTAVASISQPIMNIATAMITNPTCEFRYVTSSNQKVNQSPSERLKQRQRQRQRQDSFIRI